MDTNEFNSLGRIVPSLRKTERSLIDVAKLSGEHIEVPTADASSVLQTWLHRCGDPAAPVLFEVHGGGFALGDAMKTDALRQWVCDTFKINVIGVNYRLAPEHPFPFALEDIHSVLAFYAAQADELALGSQNYYLMGYSVGANLAIAECLKHNKVRQYRICGLVLHYPFLDAVTDPRLKLSRDIDLESDFTEAFNYWYIGDADPSDPLISPCFAADEDLAQLPELVICPVAGDAMFDEACRFAECVAQVGVPTRLIPIDDAYHGYIEDAANPAVYQALTPAEKVALRPASYISTARDALLASLGHFFTAASVQAAFPGTGK